MTLPAAAAPAAAAAGAAARSATSTCFWHGPATKGRFNVNYPDAGAAYWLARFTLPPGARLVLRGRFAHARYLSLNAYDPGGAPTDALHDSEIAPDRGSRNPYRPGADRTTRRRSYAVDVVGEAAPLPGARRAANTLYAGAPGRVTHEVIYRIYVPDRGRGVTGGVPLPEPEAVLADGRRLRGEALCAGLETSVDELPVLRLPLETYLELRDQAGKPPAFPAPDRPVWRAFYNLPFAIACGYRGECEGRPERTSGLYGNRDNGYLSALVSRRLGRVAVLEGVLPVTPRTRAGQRRVGRGQLRYWSLCQNESLATTAGAGCVYDEQVPLRRGRRYTIVTSTRADRPANARDACGVGWVAWPRRGDGAGREDLGQLILRNMLPAPGFRRSVFSTRVPGDEPRAMGRHLPTIRYTTRAAFNRRGCPAR